MNIDIEIVQFFQSLPLEVEPWRSVVMFFADSAIYAAILLFILVAVIDYARLRNGHLYLLAFASTLITRFAVVPLSYFFFTRERPFLALGFEPLLYEYSPSFPSGHTIFLFALATATWYIHRPLASVIAIVGLCVGVARVAAGVHYPSDIVGGIVLGIAVSILLRAIFRPTVEKKGAKISALFHS